jgi:hypothetical protein
MALTLDSINGALAQLNTDEGGVVSMPRSYSDAESKNYEFARLLAVVKTANDGLEVDDAPTTLAASGMFGKPTDWIVQRLSELIAKLRSALSQLVEAIADAMSFSIGISGPLLSVNINFGPRNQL